MQAENTHLRIRTVVHPTVQSDFSLFPLFFFDRRELMAHFITSQKAA